jgi:hypothetical protein
MKVGIFDTSSSNWCWSNGPFDDDWKMVEALLHQGWPRRRKDFPDLQAIFLGAILRPEEVWLYRLYPAGMDGARPGRFFFVVMRLDTLSQFTSPRVAGLLEYFDEDRGFPLNTKPLVNGWTEVPPSSEMVMFQTKMEGKYAPGYWGMDDTGKLEKFITIDWMSQGQHTKTLPSSRPKNPVKTVISAGLVAAGIGLYLAKTSRLFDKSDHNDVSKSDSMEAKSSETSTNGSASGSGLPTEEQPSSNSSSPNNATGDPKDELRTPDEYGNSYHPSSKTPGMEIHNSPPTDDQPTNHPTEVSSPNQHNH